MTDVAGPLTLEPRRAQLRAMPMLVGGLLGGLALGVVARAWMRLIAENPEFTWRGTLFIVLGFAIFGLTQSIVAVARRQPKRRRTLTVVRVIGVVGMLPLFVAAGAQMFPTVIGGGLALARVGWSRITRGICLVIAVGPVVFVGHDLVDKFGWSLHATVGLGAMLAIYATIIRATRFAFAAQTDGWRLELRGKIIISVVVGGLAFLIFMAGGGLK